MEMGTPENFRTKKVEKTPETIGWEFRNNIDKLKEIKPQLDSDELKTAGELALSVLNKMAGDFVVTENTNPNLMRSMRDFNDLINTYINRIDRMAKERDRLRREKEETDRRRNMI